MKLGRRHVGEGYAYKKLSKIKKKFQRREALSSHHTTTTTTTAAAPLSLLSLQFPPWRNLVVLTGLSMWKGVPRLPVSHRDG